MYRIYNNNVIYTHAHIPTEVTVSTWPVERPADYIYARYVFSSSNEHEFTQYQIRVGYIDSALSAYQIKNVKLYNTWNASVYV